MDSNEKPAADGDRTAGLQLHLDNAQPTRFDRALQCVHDARTVLDDALLATIFDESQRRAVLAAALSYGKRIGDLVAECRPAAGCVDA